MFGFICVVISAANVFFGITEIYKPEPNQVLDCTQPFYGMVSCFDCYKRYC
jgi:hypothetical protein